MKAFSKAKQGSATLILAVVVGIVAILGIVVAGSYNGMVDSKQRVDAASADIDTYLQRRADLIPNLVNTVKGYVKHEDEAIDKVTSSREKLVGAKTIEEKAEANSELSESLSRLFAIAEAYPDLKASANFVSLQDELSGTENRIATARKDYNDAVESYNAKIQKFPTNILAGMFNFEKADYFKADESAKEVPVVNFD